jgi:FAD/FMN-containing dehydrogenase
MEEAANVMRWYRTFLPSAPVELNGFFALLVVPPAPQFPEELHMKRMCGVVWSYTGPADMADAVLAPIRAFGPPAYDGIGEIPFPALQGAFDSLYTPGMQWYWKADFVQDLPDEAIAHHVEFGRQLPSLYSTMHLYPIDGAVHAKGRTDTAFSYRDVTWAQVIVGVDPDPANAAKITSWARDYWEATHPYAAEGAGAYVNMMMEEGQGRIRASYRENYDTLAAIKARYDPTNLFRVNQNIEPAAGNGA